MSIKCYIFHSNLCEYVCMQDCKEATLFNMVLVFKELTTIEIWFRANVFENISHIQICVKISVYVQKLIVFPLAYVFEFVHMCVRFAYNAFTFIDVRKHIFMYAY